MLRPRHSAAAARPSRPLPRGCPAGRLARAPARSVPRPSDGVGAAAGHSVPAALLASRCAAASRGTGAHAASSHNAAGCCFAAAPAPVRAPLRPSVLVRATEPAATSLDNATAPREAAPRASDAPPAPPPLSELPTPMAPDAIPPLLDWVTTAAARPVAVQCVLERFLSKEARRCVQEAAVLGVQAFVDGGDGSVGAAPPLVLPSHLAVAALSSPHPDCAAALGVLHHAGLPLQRCKQALLAAAQAEASRAGARGSSCQPQDGIFSPAAQHFLFQSYRWAIYTGHDCVLPCHLLWALSADPRVAYSRDRRDPLDPAVRPWQDWRPPLVGLLEEAGLERPAALYEQLLGVLQRVISAAATEEPASDATAAASAAERADAASPAVSKASQLHQVLHARLQASTSSDDLVELLLSCRAAGLVLSRAQVLAVDESIMTHRFRPAFAVGCQYVMGAAALGHQCSKDVLDFMVWRMQVPPPPSSVGLPYVEGPAAPGDPVVVHVCHFAAALRFQGVDAAEFSRLTWLRCPARSQPLSEEAEELLLLSDTLEAIGPNCSSSSSSSPNLRSLIAGIASQLVAPPPAAQLATPRSWRRHGAYRVSPVAVPRILWDVNCPLAVAAAAAYLSTTALASTADTVNIVSRLPWPGDQETPPWLGRLTLQQRVRLLSRLAAVRSHLAVPKAALILEAAAAAANSEHASVHASLELQRQAGLALAATGQPVSEGWLRQLVSYGPAVSKPAAEALVALLAAAEAHRDAAAAFEPPPPELLAQLSDALWANAHQPHMTPNEALQALHNLRSISRPRHAPADAANAGPSAAGGLQAPAEPVVSSYSSGVATLDLRKQLTFLGVGAELTAAAMDHWTGGVGVGASRENVQQEDTPAAAPEPRSVIWSLLRGGSCGGGTEEQGASEEAAALLQRADQMLRAPAPSADTGSRRAAEQLSGDVAAAVLQPYGLGPPPLPSPRQCLQLLVGLALLRAPAPSVRCMKVLSEGAARYRAQAGADAASGLGPAQLSVLLLWSRSLLQREFAVQALVGELVRMLEGDAGGSGGGGGSSAQGTGAAAGALGVGSAAEAAGVLLAAAFLCEVVRGLVAEGEGEAVIGPRVGGAVRGLRGRVEALEREAAGGTGSDPRADTAAAAARQRVATARQLLAELMQYG
ncbi:hypothetical protein TSOC_000355 [Tetrabaena socialis]|uniref:Uncharacterized protein n=1 Tax=Tetrabaena socialis TaxID=47790 RepID=A0A2J8AJG9_9CHLO|nr:hypothetical protein TSOC_000355 [Tetrabaena socialis]|eukprot:PNH12667.1 hypothetical protein TSOC_000355 [Tetrabaena socialis]